MGDTILDEIRSRNRKFIILAIIFVLLLTTGTLYSKYGKTKESANTTPIENSTNKPTLEKEPSKENDSKTIPSPSQNKNQTNEFNFEIKKIEDLDKRACGASPGDLFWWFGTPMHAMGWEQTKNGRGEANSFKFFIWNKTVLYTKGRMNSQTGKIQTYHYTARENLNRSIQKIIDCEAPENKTNSTT